MIGACDTMHTLAFDLNICSRNGAIEEFVYVDEMNQIMLKPCIQTCFAYTSIVKNKSEWVTVRRIRVLTHEIVLTDDSEKVTASLDMEALAVVSGYNCVLLLYYKCHSKHQYHSFIHSFIT
jgi:hypothetical protein